ncbi:hypothetical protein FHU38_005214 [Saccharomonospora amisosensis]|uniref:Uncharacterized protein n=2 Tax=Saccharomonospora TaxID=1851 RepID=H5X844_9PSEU|nr:hypothetical protein [Saccharomonospora amisosensis]EHR53576.1 hypothetical protein SacmaDRAFT_5460 [Saccharomonospora marina XMU15]NIJ14806.1 hypothetical protein [Saccharomonospora amisosensis]
MPDVEEPGQRDRSLVLEFITEDPWEQQLARDYWLVDGDGKFVYKVGDLERRAYDERPALARQRIPGLAYYLRKRVRAQVSAASCPGCGARVHVDNRPDYQKVLKLLEAGEVQACAPCRASAADAADRAVAVKRWREDHGWYDQYRPVKVAALSLREAVSLLALFSALRQRVHLDHAAATVAAEAGAALRRNRAGRPRAAAGAGQIGTPVPASGLPVLGIWLCPQPGSGGVAELRDGTFDRPRAGADRPAQRSPRRRPRGGLDQPVARTVAPAARGGVPCTPRTPAT